MILGLDFFAFHKFLLRQFWVPNAHFSSVLGYVATDNSAMWLSWVSLQLKIFFLFFFIPSDRKPAHPPALSTSSSVKIQVRSNAG